MRGNTNDQISLQFGKTDAMSFISHFILYKSLANAIKPKSLPPQCTRIKWGGSCNVDKYQSFFAMSMNLTPPPHTPATITQCQGFLILNLFPLALSLLPGLRV